MNLRSIVFLLMLLLPMGAYAGDFPAKEIYMKHSPAVVVVKASRDGGNGMISSGSIITRDGLVITNAHAIIDKEDGRPYQNIIAFIKPSKVFATKDDLDKYYEAEVLHFDSPLDLAVLRLKRFDRKTNIIEFANPQEIGVGEEVVAIGHPEQGGFWTLTYGRISAEHRDYKGVPGKDMYQTDTSVNRGNSGGPLLDGHGYMVAVNSNIARLSKDGLAITGINYSIKSSVVIKWLNDNGYSIAYGKTPVTEPKINSADAPTGQPKESLAAKPAQPKEVPVKAEQKRFETPKKPYDYDALLKAAEKDLDDMIGEMRGKFKGR